MITILCWSLGYVFTRLALRYFSPLSLGFLRYFIASVSIIIFALIIKIKMPDKNDIKWFILSGFFGFFIYIITFNIGSVNVSASTGSLIISATPVITAIMAKILFREKLRIIQYFAIIIQFLGVCIILLYNGILSINIGLIWLILASISLSIYNLLQRKLTKTYSARQVSIFSIWFGAILLLIFLPNSVTEIVDVPPVQIVYLLILGIFAGAVAYISWAYALSKAENVSSVTNYMFLTPLLTALLGILLANEIPDIETIIGGAIIITGMFIFNFYDKIFIRKNKNYI
ncbi:MAG: DMT family transporter [Treponema sp.]|nr:DMT family transporter [Treponema sp.]